MRDLKVYFRTYPNLFVETNDQLMFEKLFSKLLSKSYTIFWFLKLSLCL